ncbi:MAG TPA: nuclear transport factor 2 family protein [Ktedonobacter sp.]|nr:nuclear transport factor 2 family protein [Ktedonobacter sp.]
MNVEQIEQEVLRLADAWATAELRGDTAFLEARLTDDFIGIGPLGFMLTKQEWLARHRSGDLKYDAFNLDEVKVRVYNDAAVLTGRQVQNAAYRGNPIQGQFRTTLVFVQQQGQWQLASLQLSTIGQPPSFTQSGLRKPLSFKHGVSKPFLVGRDGLGYPHA